MDITVKTGDFDLTVGLISLTAIVWLVWDFYVVYKKERSISYWMTKWSYYSPMIPFIIGFILGHWLWTTVIYIED
jgi:hypothetical protein